MVVTLDADGLESLREQGIFEDWSHVINGIRHGFNVGVKDQVGSTVVHPNHSSSTLAPDFISSYIQSNLAQVVPAREADPLFSWRDNNNAIRPMAKPRVLERTNAILSANHAPRTFGHSFRIGGASFYMANKIDPEIVRIAGRWRSLAYETYIRCFEQVISRHLEGPA